MTEKEIFNLDWNCSPGVFILAKRLYESFCEVEKFEYSICTTKPAERIPFESLTVACTRQLIALAKVVRSSMKQGPQVDRINDKGIPSLIFKKCPKCDCYLTTTEECPNTSIGSMRAMLVQVFCANCREILFGFTYVRNDTFLKYFGKEEKK